MPLARLVTELLRAGRVADAERLARAQAIVKSRGGARSGQVKSSQVGSGGETVGVIGDAGVSDAGQDDETELKTLRSVRALAQKTKDRELLSLLSPPGKSGEKGDGARKSGPGAAEPLELKQGSSLRSQWRSLDR